MADFPSLKPGGADQIAYIRPVDREHLPQEIREQTEGMAEIWSIHSETGEVLALVDNRDKAFLVARMNEMQPVSVH